MCPPLGFIGLRHLPNVIENNTYSQSKFDKISSKKSENENVTLKYDQIYVKVIKYDHLNTVSLLKF